MTHIMRIDEMAESEQRRISYGELVALENMFNDQVEKKHIVFESTEAMSVENKLAHDKTVAFLKYLEKNNMIKKGTHKNKVIVDGIKEIVNDPDKFKNSTSSSVQFFLSEYEEWDELYGRDYGNE